LNTHTLLITGKRPEHAVAKRTKKRTKRAGFGARHGRQDIGQ
jgi:hypothetical protein